MNLNITVENIGKVNLTDRDYLAAGGEAACYVKGNLVYKIYHDSKKMIPIGKINDLKKITSSNVLRPLHVIYDKNSNEIGYAMSFQKDADPICKLFTKAFKLQNSVTKEQLNVLIANMQETISKIHNEAKCLIVDLI